MPGFDLDFWDHLTLCGVFVLGMGVLIACALALGLVLFYFWDAEWLMRSSTSPSSLFVPWLLFC
jgi:hypothetical protein